MDTESDRLEIPAKDAGVLDRIRYLIRLKRHTQASFGKFIGVDAATVSRVLSGRTSPSDAFINRIVVNLGVSKSGCPRAPTYHFPAPPKHTRRRCSRARRYIISM